jgi:MFS family permease
MSLYMIVMLGATPIGSPIVGWIGETFGPRWSIGIGSITALIVSAAAALWARKHWNVQVRYRLRSRPHLEVLHPEVPTPRRTAADQLAAREAADAQA